MPKRDGGLERAWRRRVTERDASGLTVRAFCEAEGLAESAFYYWRRELQCRAAERRDRREVGERRTRAVEVSDEHSVEPRSPQSTVVAQPRFVSVVVDDSALARAPCSASSASPRPATGVPATAPGVAVIEVVHPGGVVVRVPAEDDAAALRMILGVLDGCATLAARATETRGC